MPISAAALPLPAGAAQSVNQTNVQSSPGTSASTAITVQGSASGVVLPTSVASLPLPSGAATAALQTTGNTELTTINTTLNAPMQNSGGSVTANFGTIAGVATAVNQEVTAAGTTASNAQGVQGVTNGVPLPSTAAPNITTTGTITTADTGQTCTSTNWGSQSACTGTPTAGSAYQVAIKSAGYIWLQGVTTSGTPTVNFVIRISNDGGTTWFNRGIFQITNIAPSQINGITALNFAGWITGGVTNVEVDATTYSGSGSTTITVTQGQATPFVTSSASPSAINGTGSTSAENVQGNGPSALPVNMDLQQQNNVVLASPTAPGTSTTGNVPAIQGVTGGVPVPISGSVSASFSQFAPNANYSTPLAVGASSARTTLPSGGGSTVAVYNVGANVAFVQLGSSSVSASTADDQVAPGGFLCLGVGSNTYIAAIETAGTTTLNISGGSGGCAGSGGGGGASGTVTANAGTNLNTSALATSVNQEVTVAGTSASSGQGVQGVTGGVAVTVQCPGGGTSCFGGSVGANVTVVGVPPDASVTGSTAMTAADAASTSSTGFGGQVIVTGAPTAASAETFGLNTYQGVIVSARGTFSSTTTMVVEGTQDNSAAQTGGTAKWTQTLLTVPAQTAGNPAVASSFNGPFENAGVVVGGLQGIRCRVTTYTSSDSITCTVRTTLTDPANALSANIAALVYQNAASAATLGGAMPNQGNVICGTDGTNCQPIAVTSAGVAGSKGLATQSLPGTPTKIFALSTTITQIKGSGGILTSALCDDVGSQAGSLQIFNTVPGSATLGSPIYFAPISPGIGGGIVNPVSLTSGISVAVTTTPNGSTAMTTPPNCSFTYN
jgi:hypothetical protein